MTIPSFGYVALVAVYEEGLTVRKRYQVNKLTELVYCYVCDRLVSQYGIMGRARLTLVQMRSYDSDLWGTT